ncbi:hypothetical protein [Parabacteroides chongii]|nr:hypothetical protein [Parabacteroides chongii]WFE87118.1 hypothetical protein P3L47_06485 [Parabacteroides chongii]
MYATSIDYDPSAEVTLANDGLDQYFSA